MNKNPEVDAWLAAYDNPQKPVVAAVREAILGADARIVESIKWQAPTFAYKGNLASFFPKAKAHATLMFHEGASIDGDFPNLVGDGRHARTMQFDSLADLKTKAKELAAIVVAWCDQRDAG